MRIGSVAVSPDAIEAVISFEPDEPLRTSEADGLAARVLAALPGLKGHRCETPGAATFAQELPDTEIAHLVEHAALEIAALAGSPDTLRGDTSWDFARDGHGVFRVRLGYDDDLVVLGALTCAAGLVGALSAGTSPPDVGAEVARLRSLRSRRGTV